MRTLRLAAWLVAAVGGLGAAACFMSLADVVPPTDEPDAQTSPPEGDGGGVEQVPSTCAAPSTCRAAPPGWIGPYVLELPDGGSGTLACPAAFVRAWERSQAADAAAPPATCACSCGSFAGTCAVTVTDYQDSRCMQGGAPHVLQPSVCVPTDGGPRSFRASTAIQGGCPADASVNVPPLGVIPSAVGCAPSQPEGCEAGVCFPPPPVGARLCVRSSTEDDGGAAPACPAEYPVPLALSAGVEDTRGCSACKCTAIARCNFTYSLYTSPICGLFGQGTQRSDIGCYSPSGILSERLGSASVTGSCLATGGAPIGGVIGQTASTMCCTN